jgi:DNA topoisomerase I
VTLAENAPEKRGRFGRFGGAKKKEEVPATAPAVKKVAARKTATKKESPKKAAPKKVAKAVSKLRVIKAKKKKAR